MHTVWKGAISFGLVHVPVKMFSATEDKDISMNMNNPKAGQCSDAESGRRIIGNCKLLC